MAEKPQLRLYPCEIVRDATDNFNVNTHLIGEGAFGQVFRGTIEGIDCAIKRLREDVNQQLIAEISVLGEIWHPNLIPFRGAIISPEERCLIYDFAPGGDVSSQLPHLHWDERVRILLEAGRGLEYLHDHNILNRDFKDSNVLLLDNRAVVSDFGVSRALPNDGATHVQTRVLGTPGYIDPEYLATYQASKRSDVFAFGVFVLVLLTGRPAFDGRQNPPTLTALAEQTLNSGQTLSVMRDMSAECGEWPENIVHEFCEIALGSRD